MVKLQKIKRGGEGSKKPKVLSRLGQPEPAQQEEISIIPEGLRAWGGRDRKSEGCMAVKK